MPFWGGWETPGIPQDLCYINYICIYMYVYIHVGFSRIFQIRIMRRRLNMYRILRFKGLFWSNDAGLCRFLQHFVERHMNVKHYIQKDDSQRVCFYILYGIPY